MSDSDDDSPREGKPKKLVGFLFGNVDNELELEKEDADKIGFDERARENLSSVGDGGKLGGTTIEVQKLKDQTADEDDYDMDGPVGHAVDAVDYADEKETIIPVPQTTFLASAPGAEGGEDDYDDYDGDGDAGNAAAVPGEGSIVLVPVAPPKPPGPKPVRKPLPKRAPPSTVEYSLPKVMPVIGTEAGKPIMKFTELFGPIQAAAKVNKAHRRAVLHAKRVASADLSRAEAGGAGLLEEDDELAVLAKGEEQTAKEEAAAKAAEVAAPAVGEPAAAGGDKAIAAMGEKAPAAPAPPKPPAPPPPPVVVEAPAIESSAFGPAEPLRPKREVAEDTEELAVDDDDEDALLEERCPEACYGQLELNRWEDGIEWEGGEGEGEPETSAPAPAAPPPAVQDDAVAAASNGGAVGRAVLRMGAAGGQATGGKVDEWFAEDAIYLVSWEDGQEDELAPHELAPLLAAAAAATGGAGQAEAGRGRKRGGAAFLGERAVVEDFHAPGGRGNDAAAAAAAGGGKEGGAAAALGMGGAVVVAGAKEGEAPAPSKQLHPQMLRIEAMEPLHPKTPPPLAPAPAESADGAEGGSDGLVVSLLRRKALGRVEADEWLGDVDWDARGRAAGGSAAKVILDLNDPKMIFEAPVGKDASEFRRSAAIVLPGQPKGGTRQAFGKYLAQRAEPAPPGLEHVAHLNASCDHSYVTAVKRKGGGKGASTGSRVLHSMPAQTLLTSPTHLSAADIDSFHRPRCLFAPPADMAAAQARIKALNRKPPTKNIRFTIRSLGGRTADLSMPPDTPVLKVLQSILKKKKWADLKGEARMTLMLVGGKDTGRARKLHVESSIVDCGMRDWSQVYVVCKKVHGLFTRFAAATPSIDKPQRPPGAFSKKSELTGMSGRIYLFEYMEENPLLLSFSGMGARLQTYYRQKDRADQGAAEFERATGKAVQVLGPEDDSPFLGDVAPGKTVESMETNLYRAPVAAHEPAPTDFLLVRSATGRIHLREITQTRVVGQQEPHRKVYAPNSQAEDKAAERRLLVHVYRELRARMAKSEGNAQVSVNIHELQPLFPRQSEAVIRKRLRTICDNVQRGGGSEWVLKPGSKAPNEEELRKMMTPEMVCTYEAMRAGFARLERAHVTRLKIPERLKTAVAQLPDDSRVRKVAKYIELQLLTTPWNLTQCFAEVMKEQRGLLQLTGAGDPTGRGRGYSYLKAAAPNQPKNNPLAAIPGVPAKNAGVTGTDADLRRLSMQQSKQLLLNLGVKEEEIMTLTRWRRIDLVRTLSTAAAQDGGPAGGNLARFARGTRITAVQQLQEYTESANKIFKAQMEVLEASEGGEVLERLDAEDMAQDLEMDLEMSDDDGDGDDGKGDKDDEAAQMQELRDMMAADGEGAKEKRTGRRRLRRTIITNNPDGSRTRREEIITDASKIQEIKDMMAGGDGGGGGGFPGETDEQRKKREQRRLQEKRRRLQQQLSRAEEGAAGGGGKGGKKSKREMSIKCGACGELGHMKTNIVCRLYEQTRARMDAEAANPVKIDGTKVTFSMKGVKKKRRRGDDEGGDGDEDWDVDYSKYGRSKDERGRAARARERNAEGGGGGPAAKRQRGSGAEHRQTLSELLMQVQQVLKDAKHPPVISALFTQPVGKKAVPDYDTYVTERMDLSKIKRTANELKYTHRDQFRAHVQLILDNARRYNDPARGGNHRSDIVIPAAEALVALCDHELARRDAELANAEYRISQVEGGGGGGGGGAMSGGAVSGLSGGPSASRLELDTGFLGAQSGEPDSAENAGLLDDMLGELGGGV